MISARSWEDPASATGLTARRRARAHAGRRGVEEPASRYFDLVKQIGVSLGERLRSTSAELDDRRLQARFAHVDVVPIDEVLDRVPVRFGGEVRSKHRASPEGRPFLRVEVSDGTGTAVAVFTGRNRIRGFDLGRAVVFEGVGQHERGRFVVRNPAYTLLEAATSS